MWMWIALAWFASDNIMGWLASPILFYPLIMIAGICVVLQQLGILGPIVQLGLPRFRAQANQLLEKTPIPFRI